jgi:Fe2+ transport system protein B
MDEALQSGIQIDLKLLEKILSVPVVGTVSTTKGGVDVLKRRIVQYAIRS